MSKGVKIEEGVPPKYNHKAKTNTTEHLPTLEDILNIAPEKRMETMIEYHKKVKPFLNSYIIKKQGSRVIQLIYKWGNQEIKTSIFQSILQNWKEMIKSQYALYTISKVCN